MVPFKVSMSVAASERCMEWEQVAELTSEDRAVLTVGLAWQVISPEQMQKGFLSLVQSVSDLQIDVPEAPDLIATFVARAVVDDILPPAFVDKLPSGPCVGLFAS